MGTWHIARIRSIVIGLACFAGLVLVAWPAEEVIAQSLCHLYGSGSAVPQGFGAAWNTLVSSRDLLMRASCTGDRAFITIGTGALNQYIYKDFYRWDGTAWATRSWSGAQLVGGAWYVGDAFGELDSTTGVDYFVAYLCQWTGTQWKCGCRDSSCTTGYWQLQAFDPSHIAQGGGGGGTGTGTGVNVPSEVKPCSNPKHFTATPSNVNDVIRNAGKCSVITLEPGKYGIHIKANDVGRLDGITIRCKNPASLSGSICTATTIRLDGERRHRGDAQFVSVIIENMVFTAAAKQYGGSHDYGVIAYNVDGLRISNNIFNGTYNHDISTKEEVWHTEVTNNRFIKCRRHCIEVGQNGNIPERPTTGESMVIRGNIFENIIGNAITQRYNRLMIVEDNVFKNVQGRSVYNWPFANKGLADWDGDGDSDRVHVPKPPLRTHVINNTFEGQNRLIFMGRGVNDDVVLVKGNTGSYSCERIPMSDNAINQHLNEETTAPPKLDPGSDVSC